MLSLKNVLKLNAISSGATGLILVSLPGVIAPVMGVNEMLPIILVGAFLVLFALFVFQVSLGKINVRAVRVVVALDVTWVIASGVALVFLVPVLTPFGSATIAAIAVWVALMVYLQRKGLRECL